MYVARNLSLVITALFLLGACSGKSENSVVVEDDEPVRRLTARRLRYANLARRIDGPG